MSEESRQPGLDQNAWIAETSHDLKTYLNPIVGFASVLVQDRARLNEDQFRQVSLIYESAKKLLDRIDALAMLLKMRGGAWPQALVEVEAERLLLEVYEQLRESAKKKKIELRLEPATGLRFSSDFALLSRAMKELATFRIEHLDGGWLKLGCRLEKVEGYACIKLFLGDSGAPPSARDLERWRLFLTAEDNVAYSQKGIGLWLALAREAVRKAGGTLFLSENGEWQITLPFGSADRHPSVGP